MLQFGSKFKVSFIGKGLWSFYIRNQRKVLNDWGNLKNWVMFGINGYQLFLNIFSRKGFWERETGSAPVEVRWYDSESGRGVKIHYKFWPDAEKKETIRTFWFYRTMTLPHKYSKVEWPISNKISAQMISTLLNVMTWPKPDCIATCRIQPSIPELIWCLTVQPDLTQPNQITDYCS